MTFDQNFLQNGQIWRGLRGDDPVRRGPVHFQEAGPDGMRTVAVVDGGVARGVLGAVESAAVPKQVAQAGVDGQLLSAGMG